MKEDLLHLPSFYIRQINQLVSQCEDQLISISPSSNKLVRDDEFSWLAEILTVKQLTEVNSKPRCSLSLEQLDLLLNKALSLSNEPSLGLLLGQQLPLNTHGVLGFAAMNCGSVAELIVLLERFIALRLPIVSLKHSHVDQQLRLIFTESMPLGNNQRFILEAVMAAIFNVVSFLTNNSCQLKKVTFPFQQVNSKLNAEQYFQCEVTYDSDSASFVWSSDILSRSLTATDPDAYAEAVNMCQQELAKLTEEKSISGQLQAYLLSRHTAFPSLEQCAEFFNLTPRTLHRRLQEEGSSYRKIVESVRETLAVEHLKADRLTIQEIAYILGYSDQANFRRAFKRWRKVSPSAFRK